MSKMTLQPQEIPFDHPDSFNMFQPSAEKPLVATPGAIEEFSQVTVGNCWRVLNNLAKDKQGIDYLQVFVRNGDNSKLWFIEDGDGGAITALTPDEY